MRANIHPTYFTDSVVLCSCGHTFTTGSTKKDIRVELCFKCHPLYTGEKRFVDTLGRVDKFQQKTKRAAEFQEKFGTKKNQNKVEKKDYKPKTLRELLTEI